MVDEGVDLLRLVGVDYHAGALVQEEDVFILVQDGQLGLEEGEKQVVLTGGVEELVVDVELEHVPGLEALVPLAPLAIAFDALDADILLQQSRGKQGQGLGHKPVQPLSRVVFSDGQLSHSRS